MKIPGIGEMKPIWIVVSVGVFGGGVYLYRRERNAQSSTAAASTQDTSASIDPSTGMPYANEQAGSAGLLGSIDPTTGEPYAYETSSGTTATGATSPITSNEEWITEAEQDAQYDFGATQALAQSAVAAYIAQSPAGLPTAEYDLISQVIATIGPPPLGSFRLIQQQAPVTTPPPSGSIPGGTGGIVRPFIKVKLPSLPPEPAKGFSNGPMAIVEHNTPESLINDKFMMEG